MNNPKHTLPQGWSLKKLGEIATKIGSGVTPKGGRETYLSKGIPLVRSQNVLNGQLDLSDVAYISHEQFEKMKSTTLKPKDVLLNITGASIGRACVVPNDFKVGNVNQHVCIIRLKKEIEPYLICQFILSDRGQSIIDSYQAGGNRQGLNYDQIKSFEIPLPPLLEQQKITQVLSTWDEAIQTTTALIAQLEKRKKGLMQRFFSMKNEHWKMVRLGEIGSFSKGSGITKEELIENGIPCIRYGEIYTVHHLVIRKYHSFISEQTASLSKKIRQNDILFAGSGETLEDIGKAVAFIGGEDVYAGGDLIIFSPQNGDSVCLAYILNSAFVRKQIRAFGQGQSVVHLYSRDIEKLKLPFPPLAEQIRIAEILNAADAEIRETKGYLEQLKAQKRGLMQQLLTGKVRVGV